MAGFATPPASRQAIAASQPLSPMQSKTRSIACWPARASRLSLYSSRITARGLNLDMYDISNTDLKERMGILNAYYFPDRRYEALYQRISPVNSFRVVLSKYFGAGLDLLPDKSFYSTWPEPYRFYEVTRGVQSPDL